MNKNRRERLACLRDRAIALVNEARPQSDQAFSLRLMSILSDTDVDELSSQNCLSMERRTALAVALLVDVVVLDEILRRGVLRDLTDDESFDRIAHGNRTSFAPPHAEPKEFWYLLRSATMRWVPADEMLDVVIIENEQESLACQAYLLARKRAYSTTVCLLEASFSERWPKWQLLWKHY